MMLNSDCLVAVVVVVVVVVVVLFQQLIYVNIELHDIN